MIAVASKKISTASCHLKEYTKVRNKIGRKRKPVMEKLLQKAKKSCKLNLIVITDFSGIDLHVLHLRDYRIDYRTFSLILQCVAFMKRLVAV